VDIDGEEPYKSNFVAISVIIQDSNGVERSLILDPTNNANLLYGGIFVVYNPEKIIPKIRRVFLSSHYGEIDY